MVNIKGPFETKTCQEVPRVEKKERQEGQIKGSMRNMKENKHRNGNNIKKKLCVNTTSQFYYI